MKRNFDVVVIGGGASGLICAGVVAQQSENSVLLLEKMEKVGRKIRITGKGRCNVTNDKSKEDFLSKVRNGADFIEHAFDEFSNKDTIKFFEDNGLKLVIKQGGRAYPMSEDAWDVVRTLDRFCKKNGAKIECNSRVLSIVKVEDNFELEVQKENEIEMITSNRVVIATGGLSYPRTGSTGDGYDFANKLGHRIEPLHPSLVPFTIYSGFLKQTEGLVLKNISLSLCVQGEVVRSEFGELEFFGFGIGGATVFRLSREAVDAFDQGKEVDFLLDFKPVLSVEKLLGRFDRELIDSPRLNLEGLLLKLLPKVAVPMILSEIGLKKSMSLSAMTPGEKIKIITAIKQYKLIVINHRGVAEAIVTAGGVDLSEIDSTTMESKLCKGLYVVGEVLDVDADTGGYNLQSAFSTGYLCGKNIVK